MLNNGAMNSCEDIVEKNLENFCNDLKSLFVIKKITGVLRCKVRNI